MKKLDDHPKQVRIFYLILFVLIGFVTFKLTGSLDSSLRALIFTVEGLVLLFILLKPAIFSPVFKAALILSTFIGNLIFKMITALVFYLILTPIALAMRLFGKKFLNLRKNQNQETYFEDYVSHAGIEKQY